MGYLKTLLGTVLLASTLTPLSLATAQDVKDRNIKLALANTAESAHGVGAKRFADVVGQKSGGKMKVRIYAGGSLGGEAVVASALQGGTIEMSMMGPGLLTGMDKDFGIFDTPFLFDNFKEADAVLDGPVGKKLLDKLPAKGLIGLSYWDHGFRILANSKRPVSKMEDIQGLKVRVQQIPVFIDTVTPTLPSSCSRARSSGISCLMTSVRFCSMRPKRRNPMSVKPRALWMPRLRKS